jgi:hypothetical protein
MNIKMTAVGFLFLLLLAGAGCADTTTEETTDQTTITIPEIGIALTAPADYDYSRLDEGVYHLTTPGGSKTVTLQSFGSPEVPAEVVENAEGLANALGSILQDFEVTNEETLANGFILDYTAEADEAFSAIIKTNGGTILCEPEMGAFVFEFENLKDLCRSITAS